ncbi:MAG: sigma 54-interacting transcriptional regulator [Candidatus Metalachnospira sp.]|nr:sigma 54-interacting transcriptional regulator [Candidatus Metalachnospira sp.]
MQTSSITNIEKIYEDIIYYYQGSIIVTDARGKLIFCNRGTCMLTGLTKGNLIGRSAYDLKREKIFSESSITNTIESGKPNICYLLINEDKNRGVYAYSTPVFDENGKLDRVITFSQGEAFSSEYFSRIENEKKHMKNIINQVINSKEQKRCITKNAHVKELFDFSEQIANVNTNIMIYGESGTGKEILAKHIHNSSSRNKEIFIPINCAAIPDELFESELFGYEKGSFTGARREGKLGLLEVADHGTLFLDEIGEMPLNIQPKLLRFLETGEVRRLGGNQFHSLDVRVIAATNKNLFEMSKKGMFREDLYYRLNIMPMRIPPLRERPEDIEPLIMFFLNIYNKKFDMNVSIPKKYIEMLKKYSWPGNVRELKNIVQRYTITNGKSMASTFKYLCEDNKCENFVDDACDKPVKIKDENGKVISFNSYMDFHEAEYLRELLGITNGNVSMMAAHTGMHISGIYRKLNKYGLMAKKYNQS